MIAATDTPHLNALLDRLQVDLSRPEAETVPGPGQSLGQGAAGIALLHLERAATGTGDPRTAHAWLIAAAAEPVSASARTGIYAGAPALAFVLDIAEQVFPGRYTRHRDRLLDLVVRTVHRRLDAARERLQNSRPTSFDEYDLVSGLTGLGRLLLRTRPDEPALGRVLEHLIALTEPVGDHGDVRPGWWVDHDPDPLLPTPGGHANYGLAHGITGPLALLAIAHRNGCAVDGQTDAIARLTGHLRAIAQRHPAGTWWPQWTTATGHPHEHGRPPRPSWCYGTPGIARSLQLAAIATDDTALQQNAADALAANLTHPAHRDQLTEAGLCHGWAGAILTAWHAARDATSPQLATLLPEATARFTNAAARSPGDHSFLGGAAGIALTAAHLLADTNSTTGWEQCLLLT
ncbi:lanthionine synthetase C family protein [Glycomyces albus]